MVAGSDRHHRREDKVLGKRKGEKHPVEVHSRRVENRIRVELEARRRCSSDQDREARAKVAPLAIVDLLRGDRNGDTFDDFENSDFDVVLLIEII